MNTNIAVKENRIKEIKQLILGTMRAEDCSLLEAHIQMREIVQLAVDEIRLELS